MEKKKVLVVTQEMKPYLNESPIAAIARQLPQYIMENGYEIRVLMPRFGNINERRHRLHEVVRLSGINIVVENDDYPLMIKVASLPGARMQVYFLDNEDFFQRKSVFRDENEKFHDDNAERMVFFCKGVLETVKKFGWAPDIIHCHGWMTSLIPLYLKTAYKNDPIFNNSKVIYSVYGNEFEESMKDKLAPKALISSSMGAEDLKWFENADNSGLNAGASRYADGIIVGSENVDDELEKLLKSEEKPTLDYSNGENFLEDYSNFYQSILQE